MGFCLGIFKGPYPLSCSVLERLVAGQQPLLGDKVGTYLRGNLELISSSSSLNDQLPV